MQIGTDYSLGSVQGLSPTGSGASFGQSGTAPSSATTALRDQYSPGGSSASASAYDSYGRPSSRRVLDQDQLMAKRSAQRRLAQERHAIAVEKSGMYEPGPALPLPVSSPGSVLAMAVPVAAAVGAGALAASALDKKEETKPVETPKELPKEKEAEKQQPPPVVNYTPPDQEINVETDDGNIITDAAGLAWDGVSGVAGLAWDGISTVGGVAYDATGALLSVPLSAAEGAAFGTGLIAGPALATTVGTAYFAGGGSLNPVVGAKIIGSGASSLATEYGPAAQQGATDIVAAAIKQAMG